MAFNRDLSQLANFLEVNADGSFVNIIPSTSQANLGIGTNNPTSKLTVLGDGKFIGVVTATSGFVGALTGLASSATQLATGRTVAITGDLAYTSGSFNGTSNVTGIATLATVNSNVGEFGSQTAIPVITVNAKGLVTAVTTAAVGTALTVTGDSGSVGIDLLTETLTISGGTNLTSVGSGNSLTINLDNNISLTSVVASGVITATSGFVGALTGTATSTTNIPNLTGDITSVNTATTLATVNSNVGEFGSQTAIPVITVNAKGLVTAVTTAAVGTALTVTGDSGSVGIDLLTETLTISGGTNLTSVGSGNSLTINLDNNISLGIVTANEFKTGTSGAAIGINTNTISGPAVITIDPAGVGDNTGAVRIKGDLFVDGTQFIVNSTTIELADFIVGIASTATTDILADGAGIKIGPDNTLTYDHTNTALKSSENFNLASGKTYKINGTDVLSNNTLASGVVNSSLTSVGTLTNLSVGNVNSSGIITATSGFVGALTGTATSTTNIPNLTGDITSVNTATTLATVNSNVGEFGSQTVIPVITVNAKGLITSVGTAAVGTALTVAGDSGSVDIDLLTETLTISGGTNLTSVGSGNSLTINLDNNISLGIVTATTFVGALTGLASSATQLATGRTVAITGDLAYTSGSFNGTSNVTGIATLATVNSNVGEFGSQTAIPVITVNAKGLITSVGTAAVGTALTVAGDSGSVDIDLLTETLTISGGTNLTSVGSGNSLTINLDNNISLGIVTANEFKTGTSGAAIGINTNTISGPATITIDPAGVGDNTGAVRIKGDLFVDGTQFIVNSTTIELADFIVGIASTATTDILADGAGIKIGPDNTLTYDHTNTALKSSENFNLASGKTYKINGTDVLSNNTLASGVVNSSLISLGTLTNLSVNNVTGVSTLGVTTTTNLTSQQLNVSGVSTVTNLNIGGYVSVGNTTGTVNQVIVSTGVGVTYKLIADLLPQTRTGLTTTATASQTVFNFAYNVNFLDVFVNGVKLSAGEFTAVNGTSITLSEGTFANDIVEFVSYATVGAGTGQVSSLNDLTDVTISGVTTGNILAYNGSQFVNTSTLSGITTLDATTTATIEAAITAAPSGAVSGLIVRNSTNTIVGTSGSISQLTFGTGLSVTGSAGPAGIATITLSSNIVGTSLSITGISTFVGGVVVGSATTFAENLVVQGNARVTGILTVGTASIILDGVNNTIKIGTGITLSESGSANYSGTLTAASFVGSGYGLTATGAIVTNILYVTKDGSDTNTGTKLSVAKATIAGAIAAAGAGTVIKVSAGSYVENNPITIPEQVSIIGDSLREVSVSPQNANQDLFYVANGDYIAEMSFTGSLNSGKAIVAFNPVNVGYFNASPYVQNCTNFIPNSIGMKIDGSKAIGPTKSMVVDSYTQYNQGGIGVSITNEGYAQLVSLFTICNETAIFCGSGSACDLTNSNSSFGNYGLVADGIGSKKYTGIITTAADAGSDTFVLNLNVPTLNVSSAVYNNVSGIVTVTTSSNHNFNVGMGVTISGLKFNCNSVNTVTNYNISTANYTSTTGILTVTTSTNHNFSVGISVTMSNLVFSCNSGNGISTAYFPPAPGDNNGDSNYIFDVISLPASNQFVVNVGTSTITHSYVNGGVVSISTIANFPSGDYGYIFEVVAIGAANSFSAYVGVSTLSHTYNSGGTVKINTTRPYDGQVVYFEDLYYTVGDVTIGSGGTGYTQNVDITFSDPSEPWGITATAVGQVTNGSVTSVQMVSNGRGYTGIPTVTFASPNSGINTATGTANLIPTYYSILRSTPISGGICTITVNDNVPYAVGLGSTVPFFKQSRVLASGHSLEYIGSGTNINSALPNQGGVTIQENEIDMRNGGLVVFTSTDQSGNFRIGDGVVINQQNGTVSGTSYTKSLFSTMTPFILALGGD